MGLWFGMCHPCGLNTSITIHQWRLVTKQLFLQTRYIAPEALAFDESLLTSNYYSSPTKAAMECIMTVFGKKKANRGGPFLENSSECGAHNRKSQQYTYKSCINNID